MAAGKKCKVIVSMERVFSPSQKKVLFIMLGGVYNCPLCKTQHQLSWEESSNEEVV